MKLIDFSVYSNEPNFGWCVDIFKFSKKSIITFDCEQSIYQDMPSILVQIGPTDLFSVSLGCIKFILTLSLWANHYDY